MENNNNIKTLEMTMDSDINNPSGVQIISLVEEPAVEEYFLYFSKQEEVQADKQIAVGPVLIPNQKILRIDANGKPYNISFPEEVIELAMQKFMAGNKNTSIDSDHNGKINTDSYIFESWLIEDPKTDKANTIYGFNLCKGTWMIKMKIQSPKAWERVKNKELQGFSIEGMFYEAEEIQAKLQVEAIANILMDETISSYEKSAIAKATKIISDCTKNIAKANRTIATLTNNSTFLLTEETDTFWNLANELGFTDSDVENEEMISISENNVEENENIQLANSFIVYKYSGPTAEREFCRRMLEINRYYTENEIVQLNNSNPKFAHSGGEYSIMKYKGGVNCQHYWTRYVVKANGTIVNTGNAKGLAGTKPEDMPNGGAY